jgi:hypothetical protein
VVGKQEEHQVGFPILDSHDQAGGTGIIVVPPDGIMAVGQVDRGQRVSLLIFQPLLRCILSTFHVFKTEIGEFVLMGNIHKFFRTKTYSGIQDRISE